MAITGISGAAGGRQPPVPGYYILGYVYLVQYQVQRQVSGSH